MLVLPSTIPHRVWPLLMIRVGIWCKSSLTLSLIAVCWRSKSVVAPLNIGQTAEHYIDHVALSAISLLP
jgi:hypothetical protein